MTRIIGLALCGALVALIAVTLIGRAIDAEVQDRVILTRNGETLDCARYLSGHGAVHYGDCNRVP